MLRRAVRNALYDRRADGPAGGAIEWAVGDHDHFLEETHMRKIAIITALILAAAPFGGAFAGDGADSVTLQGEVMCAMCIMKEDGIQQCQNVLQVSTGDESVNYYLVKNDVAEEFGPACSEGRMAQVTGTVADEDGRIWLTATKMVPVVTKKG
jgi:hypothetical protein